MLEYIFEEAETQVCYTVVELDIVSINEFSANKALVRGRSRAVGLGIVRVSMFWSTIGHKESAFGDWIFRFH